VTERRHYRLMASPLVPTWILANPAGFRAAGIPFGEADYDLLLIYPSETPRADVNRAIAMLSLQGHLVTEAGS